MQFSWFLIHTYFALASTDTNHVDLSEEKDTHGRTSQSPASVCSRATKASHKIDRYRHWIVDGVDKIRVTQGCNFIHTTWIS